jgi:hypothetical protein
MNGAHAIDDMSQLDTPSVVINNLNPDGITARPNKTQTPLIIDTNTVLPLALALQGFKPVVGRNFYVIQIHGSVQNLQLALSNTAKVNKLGNSFPFKKRLRISAFETLDHAPNI